MTEEPELTEPVTWMKIHEAPHGVVTEAQEKAIRDFARSEGFETLRGWSSYMRMREWDYYEILREFGT